MLEKLKCFEVLESVGSPGLYYVSPIHVNFNLISTKGSFNVICARLFNISYANYLRLCRDELDAIIVGKDSYYPVTYFKSKEAAQALVNLLNSRAYLVLWERAGESEEEKKK